jgi:hypothetical protein
VLRLLAQYTFSNFKVVNLLFKRKYGFTLKMSDVSFISHCGLFFCHFLASAAVLGGLLLLLFFSVTGFAATTVYLWCMMLCFNELLCIIHESAIASVRLVFSSCYGDAIAHWVEY